VNQSEQTKLWNQPVIIDNSNMEAEKKIHRKPNSDNYSVKNKTKSFIDDWRTEEFDLFANDNKNKPMTKNSSVSDDMLRSRFESDIFSSQDRPKKVRNEKIDEIYRSFLKKK